MHWPCIVVCNVGSLEDSFHLSSKMCVPKTSLVFVRSGMCEIHIVLPLKTFALPTVLSGHYLYGYITNSQNIKLASA